MARATGDPVLDRLVVELTRPGSGWRSADGKTDKHNETANVRLWERELRKGKAK